jgi:hypothetical protein
MAVRQAAVASQVQDTGAGEGPRVAYLVLSGGVYVWHVGSKAADADAFFKLSGGVYVMDDDPAEESRVPYLTGTSTVNL